MRYPYEKPDAESMKLLMEDTILSNQSITNKPYRPFGVKSQDDEEVL